jgi:DNA repair protein RadA/Sms
MGKKSISKYVCQQCGYESAGWLGKCPNCGSWNSLTEEVSVGVNSKLEKRRIGNGAKPVRLGEVEKKKMERISTGLSELDRALGGGMTHGQVVLVAGEPGIGKSTLLLQVANLLRSGQASEGGSKVLYVSGEESAEQVALRAERLGISREKGKGEREKGIFLLAETDIDEVIGRMGEMGEVGLVIVDSIQTMITTDLAGVAGSVGQVRECAARIAQEAKRAGIPVFIVGHVTKEGAIAGPRVLEHLVDTVLWFEGTRSESLRVVRAIKNRFGPTDEAGVFEMTDKGLTGVENPSALFLSERKDGEVSGSAVTCLIEGTRPLLVEIQALVVPSQLAIPRRVASGVDFARLQLIVAVLTRRMGLPLGTQDVFVNVAGGIQVEEPAADLAIAVAIASAYRERSVGAKTVIFGEVGLLGEVRSVGQSEKREKEAKRLGFLKVVGPGRVRTVGEAMREAMGK